MYAHTTQVNPMSQQKQYIAYDNKMHIPRKLWPTSSSGSLNFNFDKSG